MSATPDPKKTKRMLALIGAISLAPFIGSLLLFYFWKPQNFTNYGTLLPVTPLESVSVATTQGEPFRISDLRGQWAFVMVDESACDARCRAKLYLMRQIRLTQGKDQGRIERVWVIEDGRKPDAALSSEYAGTIEVLAANGEFSAMLPAEGSPRDHVYMLDPFGNLMMRFPRDPDLTKVKRDVNRLMKASSGWVQTK